jgi:integrase
LKPREATGSKPLHVLALNTSMRRAELVALKWEYVDLEDSLLLVRRTLTHADATSVIGEPKTKNSRHTIGLTMSAMTIYRQPPGHLPLDICSHLLPDMQEVAVLRALGETLK